MHTEHSFYYEHGGDFHVYVSENRTKGNGGGSHKDKKNVIFLCILLASLYLCRVAAYWWRTSTGKNIN
jgi:hypothetical protein